MNIELETRPATEADYNFIEQTWIKSLQQEPSFFQFCPKSLFNREYSRRIRLICSKAKISIAHDPNDPESIYAYIVAETSLPVIHYVYTKKIYRNQRIARALIEDYAASFKDKRIRIVITHLTLDFVSRFFAQKKKIFIFNPFSFRELGYEKF